MKKMLVLLLLLMTFSGCVCSDGIMKGDRIKNYEVAVKMENKEVNP